MHGTNNKIDRCPTSKRFKTPFVYNISLSAIMPQESGEAKPRLQISQPLDSPQGVESVTVVEGVT
jgi:hypothetical protein